MIFTTIPLPSIVRSNSRCICCNRKIKMEKQMYYESNQTKGSKVHNIYDYVSSDDVNYIDGHVYDYKCNRCCTDRDYNMSDRYNITHPIKEFMI